MRYSLRINGLDNAYIREFGCTCARCQRQSRAANTSVSLIGVDETGQAAQHVLFDAGAGVMDSLLAHPELRPHPELHTAPRLDAVILTHWHSDHSAELTRICTTLARSKRRAGLEVNPVPVCCRSGSAAWLERLYPHLRLSGLELRAFGGAEAMGTPLEPIPVLPEWTITPLSLAHSSADLSPENPGQHQPCCAGYILERQGYKLAFLWDADATNLWLANPDSPAVRRLHGADQVFFDANTWAYSATADGRPASHASFSLIQRFARAIEPRQTWLVHLSGHEDTPGHGFGWEDATWQAEAQRVWAQQGLPGAVRVPGIGESISLERQAHLVTAV